MKFARIENGIVCELGEFDSIEGRFHPSMLWVECGPEVQIGWTHADGVFSSPASPPLEDLKIQKTEELRQACQAAVLGGVSCNALGAIHVYPTLPQDQANLSATVLAAQVNGVAGEPYKFWCADQSGIWARRGHTVTQIVMVGEAVRLHVVDLQNYYAERLAALDQAQNAVEVAAVIW